MNFFCCSTRASTLVFAINLLTQVPVQKFPFLFISIIPCIQSRKTYIIKVIAVGQLVDGCLLLNVYNILESLHGQYLQLNGHVYVHVFLCFSRICMCDGKMSNLNDWLVRFILNTNSYSRQLWRKFLSFQTFEKKLPIFCFCVVDSILLLLVQHCSSLKRRKQTAT